MDTVNSSVLYKDDSSSGLRVIGTYRFPIFLFFFMFKSLHTVFDSNPRECHWEQFQRGEGKRVLDQPLYIASA